MSIRQLPDHVVDKIKSSVVITTLNGVVAGLVKNSLDACATKINVTLDYSRGDCAIVDNGVGIPPAEFTEEGGLGKLHHTSKFPSKSHLHGVHGNFLASLGTLSLLSVTSHHHSHASHNAILIHNSSVLTRHVPAAPEHQFTTFDHGSRIVVRDLFGSMPVRVKHRGAVTSDRSNIDKEWTQLVLEAVAILLAWPTQMTLTLKDSRTHRELCLRSPDGSDIVSRASRLLVQSSLTDSETANSWMPISASAGLVSVRGAISTTPSANRRSQFISMGIRPLANTQGVNILHEEVNRVFKNSSFGVIETGPQSSCRCGDDCHGTNDAAKKDLKTRKGMDRWPMFYFNVKLRMAQGTDRVDDVLDAHPSNLMAVVDLLKAVCYSFLKKEHFRPHKIHLSNEDSVFSTATKLASVKKCRLESTSSSASNRSSRSSSKALDNRRPESPFAGWHRIKIGHATTHNKQTLLKDSLEQQQTRPKLVGDGGKLLRKPFDEPGDVELSPTHESIHFGAPNMPDLESTKSQSESPVTGLDLKNRNRNTHHRRPGDPSEWLSDVLRSWHNPVFENAPASIPLAYRDSLTGTDELRTGVRSSYFGSDDQCGIMFESMSVNIGGRVSKQALSQAEVISQVDRKFILVRLRLEGAHGLNQADGSALVILDQHAVDERCRLERLMLDYFIENESDDTPVAGSEALDRPLSFEVSKTEGDNLRLYQYYFAAWGIQYSVTSSHSSDSTAIVQATSLPPSIMERCLTEPRLLIDLLRGQMLDHLHPPRLPAFTHTSHISNFHGCPKGILELLHSRSCRTAIMFNDVLSKEECENLVERLASCTFPFQCAHGRPSMAPLIDLGTGSRVGEWDGDEQGTSLSRWRACLGD